MARKREQAKTEQLKTTRYRDIAAELQKAIRIGTYPVGDLLPTEKPNLMARYKASRQTVREALRIIIEQGLIVRRAGARARSSSRLSRRCCSPTASSR